MISVMFSKHARDAEGSNEYGEYGLEQNTYFTIRVWFKPYWRLTSQRIWANPFRNIIRIWARSEYGLRYKCKKLHIRPGKGIWDALN